MQEAGGMRFHGAPHLPKASLLHRPPESPSQVNEECKLQIFIDGSTCTDRRDALAPSQWLQERVRAWPNDDRMTAFLQPVAPGCVWDNLMNYFSSKINRYNLSTEVFQLPPFALLALAIPFDHEYLPLVAPVAVVFAWIFPSPLRCALLSLLQPFLVFLSAMFAFLVLFLHTTKPAYHRLRLDHWSG